MRPCRALVALWAACSDSGLVARAPDPGPPQDNLLTVRGTFCLEPPEQQPFSLKVLFIMDASGSMQFTDPSQRRVIAVQEVLDHFAGTPGVEVAFVRFNESSALVPPEGFTADLAALAPALDALRVADSLTNYQAALATAFSALAQDLERVGPAARARTRYVVVFLTDGTPDPRCAEGCGGGTGDQYAFCDSGSYAGGGAIEWADFSPCEDYNQPYQILQKVREIVALGEAYGAGDLRLHTALLCPDDLLPAAAQAFGIDCQASADLLTRMAIEGRGSFRNFSAAEQIDYLDFDLRSIAIEYALRSLVAFNASAAPDPEAGFVPDSDADGLPDARERAAGTDPLRPDSDADGYGDLLEDRARAAGYDPLAADRPGDCRDPDPGYDEDGDGLSDCAERALGLDRDRPDSDGDGLPDFLELTLGTDPARADGQEDRDFDGVANADEVRARLSPIARDDEGHIADVGYRYGSAALPSPGRTCFQFEVARVGLVTPLPHAALPGAEAAAGDNDIQVWIGEGLLGTPADPGLWRRARVCARWIAPDYKDPASGVIELGPDAFVPLWEADDPCLRF